jgi:hypothetical protein
MVTVAITRMFQSMGGQTLTAIAAMTVANPTIFHGRGH